MLHCSSLMLNRIQSAMTFEPLCHTELLLVFVPAFSVAPFLASHHILSHPGRRCLLQAHGPPLHLLLRQQPGTPLGGQHAVRTHTHCCAYLPAYSHMDRSRQCAMRPSSLSTVLRTDKVTILCGVMSPQLSFCPAPLPSD